MAIVKYGAIIVDSKGSVGGTTFKGTKAGAVMQNKVTTAPSTDGKVTKADAGRSQQGGNRVNMQRAINYWKNLSQEDKMIWNEFAPSFPFRNKFGEEYVASGYQCFLALNLNLMAVDQALIQLPPTLEPMPDMPTIVLTMPLTGTSTLVQVTTNVPAGYILSLDFALIRSKGRQPQLKDYRTYAVYPAGSIVKAPAWQPPPTDMNKAELVDAIASGAKLTKADAGIVIKNPYSYPAGITIED